MLEQILGLLFGKGAGAIASQAANSPWGQMPGLSGLFGGDPLKKKEGGGGMSLELIFAITQGLNMLLSLFQPSQTKLMETQGQVATQTQKDLMDYRMEMANKLGVKPPYQSPYLGEVDPVIAKALMANLGRTSNWGWPEGQGIDTDFITQALKNMQNIPAISTGPSPFIPGAQALGTGSPGMISPGMLRRG